MLRQILKSLILEPPETDNVESIRGFDIPANAIVLRSLHKFAPTYPYVDQIKEVRGNYAISRQIDGHPDLQDYLWEDAGADLPLNTRWVIRARAAFANPQTNTIFAIVDGTHPIRIRIPTSALDDFPELHQTDQQASSASCVWVASRLNEAEDKRLLQIAFDASASPSS